MARFIVDRDFVRDVRAGKVSFFGSNLQPESGPTFDSGLIADVSFMGDVLVMHYAGSTKMAPAPK